MLLARHDPDGEDYEGPAFAEAFVRTMADVRQIKHMMTQYLEAAAKRG